MIYGNVNVDMTGWLGCVGGYSDPCAGGGALHD